MTQRSTGKVGAFVKTVRVFSQKTLLALFSARHTDFRTFLLFFLLATFIWLFNELNKQHSVLLSYPIEFQYDSHFIAINQIPKKVLTKVNASGWHILTHYFDFWKKPITYSLALNQKQHQYEIGGYKLKVNEENGLVHVQIPKESLLNSLKSTMGGLNENSVEPIDITFDQETVRTIKLGIRLEDIERKLPKDYELPNKITIEPKTIKVRGPKNWVNQIPEPFYISLEREGELSENFSKKFKIQLPNQESGLLGIDVSEVKVSFSLVKYALIPVSVAIRVKGFPQNTFLEKEKVTLLCYVPQNDIANVRGEEFILEADYATFNANENTVALKLLQKPAFIKGKPTYPLRIKIIR